MPVLLRTRQQSNCFYHNWVSISGTYDGLDPVRKYPNIAYLVEKAFDEIRDEWWDLGLELGSRGKLAHLAHAPTSASYNCDLGLMLAWSKLVSQLATETKDILVVCEDPWLFRHLSALPKVNSGRQPLIWPTKFRLGLRGLLARIRLVRRVVWYSIITRYQRKNHFGATKAIIVYGHPSSRVDGSDAYFRDLMMKFPGLVRLVHTDGGAEKATELASDKRTASLHGWGSIVFSLNLLFVLWWPSREHITGPYKWLVRRAAAKENGTASLAGNYWQEHCQNRWLYEVRPEVIAWPWENHPWERMLVRSAKALKIRTCGYQHTVVGRHQYNYSIRTNVDGLGSFPDIVISSGPAYARRLIRWGVPAEMLIEGGALQIERQIHVKYEASGPIFVALSSNLEVSQALMEAVDRAAKNGAQFLVKQHPLYPFSFNETDSIRETKISFPYQKKLSAMLYGTGTSGLESLLAGIPTFRLLPDNCIAVDILPDHIEVELVTVESFETKLVNCSIRPDVPWETVYSVPNYAVWEREIGN